MSEERRKFGRPPLRAGEASTVVHLRVCVSDYDRAFRLASEHRVTVPEIFRRAFHRCAPRDDDPDHD